ncbi:MAG: hypothetical protein ACR2IJ_01535 [Fluviibacter sp.]
MRHHNFYGEDVFDDLSCHERMHKGARKLATQIAVREIGRHIAFGGKGGGGSAPSPDPQIGAAALKNAQLGEEWLSFAKDQFAAGNIRQEDMDALTNKVIEQQLSTQEQQAGWATEDRARYKDTFQPLEDQFIQEANNYGSPERQAQAAAEAKADVMSASETQKAITQRQMASMGINPNSGKFQAISRAGDVNTALASAGAQNNARTMVRDKGLALKADAVNMGKGLPSQSAAAAGLGLNAGNMAVGNQTSANQNFYANNGVMQAGFGGAMQGYSNQGNILNNLYGNQVNAWSAQQQANNASAAGTGQLFGSVLGAGASLGGAYMMAGAL